VAAHDHRTGRLLPSDDVDAMARALLNDFLNPAAARAEIGQRFSLECMVAAYGDLYQRLIATATGHGAGAPASRVVA